MANKVFLCGRLTRDPEIRYGNNDTVIAKFNIAVDRRFKREGEPDADFFNCNTFGKTAEFVEKYLKKGRKIILVGRVQNNNYTNKDGQQVYGTVIMVDELEFAESKSSQTESKPQTEASDGSGFMNVPDGIDDDLPFA